MFRNVLVPVDLADRHEKVLDAAIRLLEPDGRIVLLHVVEMIPGLPREEEQRFYERLEMTARSHLEALGMELTERSVNWRAEVIVGSRAADVVRVVIDQGNDLVVLASHRIEPDQPVRGTLSYQVSVLVPCPVLLIK